MRFLGIDYGSKRVGLAVSDEDGKIAFPKTVLANDSSLLDALAAYARQNGAATVILGESKDGDGADNPIMESIRTFKIALEEKLGLPVIFEPEFFSSVQAARQEGNTALDASAAAIILQSYLDRINKEQHDNDR